MKSNKRESIILKSFKEQQVILSDERHINIHEKTSYAVSKVMNWLLIGLLFITGTVTKDYTSLFMISLLIIVKLALTLGYAYYYSRKI